MKQRPFALLSFDAKKKPTRREKFLSEMDKVHKTPLEEFSHP